MQQPETWAGKVPDISARGPAGVDVQRILDLGLSLLALPLALPLMAVAMLLIKLDSPGPAIFRQRRLGLGGHPFELFKLRSMSVDADPELHRRHVGQLIGSDWRHRAWRRLDGDPRITRVGRWLRASGLDELPQLINVLRGEMSLVGPRPALPYEAELWQDWHHARLDARPGITGLWQVEGRDAVDFDGMVRLDIEYIRRRSLALDLQLIARTPLALLHRWRDR